MKIGRWLNYGLKDKGRSNLCRKKVLNQGGDVEVEAGRRRFGIRAGGEGVRVTCVNFGV